MLNNREDMLTLGYHSLCVWCQLILMLQHIEQATCVRFSLIEAGKEREL